MQRSHNSLSLTLAAAITLTLAGMQSASAQDAADTAVKANAMECPEMAYESAYETSPEFIAWLRERPERMTVLSDAQRQAIFKQFAEQQARRIHLAAQDGR